MDMYLVPVYQKECKVNQVAEKREWSPPDNYDRDCTAYNPLTASIEHIFEVNKERPPWSMNLGHDGPDKILNHLDKLSSNNWVWVETLKRCRPLINR